MASTCGAGLARERVLSPGLDYQRIPFAAQAIDPTDRRYAWTNSWGRVQLRHGSLISSADPALYQILRYTPTFSTALIRTGHYLAFEPVSLSDRRIVDIRLAAAPELTGGPSIGASLTQPRPGRGRVISGYRFQMAERLMGSGDSVGLWRNTGLSGARTRWSCSSPRLNRPGEYATRIIGRSDIAFSLISQTNTTHGGIWSFTLFTEAECPNGIAMLNYGWFLYVRDIGRPSRGVVQSVAGLENGASRSQLPP